MIQVLKPGFLYCIYGYLLFGFRALVLKPRKRDLYKPKYPETKAGRAF